MKAEGRQGVFSRAAVASAAALTALFLLFPAVAEAGAPVLSFPLQCVTGKDCWLYQYVDIDPGPGARDHMCGSRSYEGHKGTDIAIEDLKAMERGVTVLAAAGGKVRNIRDGVPDHVMDEENRSDIEGRECGNGVAIEHGDGWETMYCHMRSESIRVKPGEEVKAGQGLGLVGLSGQTQFPHLHFAVRHAGKVVDPFLGTSPDGHCGLSGKSLWASDEVDRTRYSPADIYQAGFSNGPPDPEAAYAGKLDATELSRTVPALVAWTTVAAVRPGDRLTVRLRAPSGEVIANSETVLKKTQVRYFAYAGRRRPGAAWPSGDYTAEISLVRQDDRLPVDRTASRTLTIR